MTRDEFEKALSTRGYTSSDGGESWAFSKYEIMLYVPRDADQATFDVLLEKIDEIVKEKTT